MATAPIVTAATGHHVGAPLRSSSPSPFGLWYGKKSSSSCSPTTDQLIYLYQRDNIEKMWLCCDTPQDGEEILHHINSREANIQVVLYIPTQDVRKIADTTPVGNDWIRLITEYQLVISHVCLGNVDQMNNINDNNMIGRAMDIIHSINAESPIKASTIIDVNTIFGSYNPQKCPSEYTFRKFRDVLFAVFTRLVNTSTPLFVKTFPNFAIRDNIGLDNYLLEECADTYLHCRECNYKYVFDAMVDSISCAINAINFTNVGLSVVSGWPTAGSSEATIENAQKYNNNLLRHLNEDTPRKTKRIDHFIFSLLDEDLLPPDGVLDWKHFGTFTLFRKETFPPTEMYGSAEAT